MKKSSALQSCLAIVLCCLCPAIAGATVLWDFEPGSPAFSSDLEYDSSPPFNYDGQWTIARNPLDWWWSWCSMGDHTSGGGSMLLATPEDPGRVWYAGIPVEAGATYGFSGWAAVVSLHTPRNEAFFSVQVSDTEIGQFTLAGHTPGEWVPFDFHWQSPASGIVNLVIVDLQTDPWGNDFVLDDLTFTAIPEPATLVLVAFGGLFLTRRK